MKKHSFIFFGILVLILALTACSSAVQQTPAGGGVETTPVGGEIGAVTETVPAVETEAVATEEVSTGIVATESVATTEAPVVTDTGAPEGTPQATEDAVTEATQALPNTGPVDNTRASNLLGQTAYSADGESAGVVEDLAINLVTSQVDYIILRPEGQEGVDGFVPVPWQAFNFENGLVLSVDSEVYSAAPILDINAPRFMISEDWEEFYGLYWEGNLGSTGTVTETVTPEATETVTPTLEGVILGRELLDQEIQGPTGETAGTVSDVMLDPNNGQVLYILLEVGEGTETRIVPVPLHVLERPASNQPFILPLDANTLSQVPEIDLENLDLTVPGWDEALQTFWQSVSP